MTVDKGPFGTATEVSQFLMGTTAQRGITLYISGKPSGSAESRSNYWSLSQEQAVALGLRLVEETVSAKANEELEIVRGVRV